MSKIAVMWPGAYPRWSINGWLCKNSYYAYYFIYHWWQRIWTFTWWGIILLIVLIFNIYIKFGFKFDEIPLLLLLFKHLKYPRIDYSLFCSTYWRLVRELLWRVLVVSLLQIYLQPVARSGMCAITMCCLLFMVLVDMTLKSQPYFLHTQVWQSFLDSFVTGYWVMFLCVVTTLYLIMII